MAVDSGRILNRSWIVMVFLVTLVLVLVDPTTAATTYNLRSLSKRSFFDINCKGTYNARIYARLELICQDCYNLYREPELHKLCT